MIKRPFPGLWAEVLHIMRLPTRLICWLPALCLFGCSDLSETSGEPSPDKKEPAVVRPANEPVKRESGPIVFRARYSRERGPHIKKDKGHAWVY